MTTQQPTGGNPPNLEGILGEPNGEYVPEGLELLQAHWFARHGERTRESSLQPVFLGSAVPYPNTARQD